ncbi:MAG: hypothetical protein DHS20C19_25060 [Acidimicrobiales bacterium]|nr:MAG: hypothetical protein DHS20C19_25060 [Acidimicrobiales bacterium]
MPQIIVRYRTTEDHADANQALVEEVFAELHEADPGGLRYATFRLADGTFVHIADVEGEENPLTATAAFARFTETLPERCAEGEGPDPQPATLVGSYRLVAD